jgi:DNA polymerase I
LLTYEYVTSAERLGAIAREISAAERISLDLETTGFSPFNCVIRLCSINTGKNIYVIDVFKTGTLGAVLEALHNPNQLTGAGHPLIIGQNLKFDQKFFLHIHGVELWPVFDTFRASALLHNGRRMGHNLYDLYDRELHMQPEAQDLGGSDWSANELTKAQLDYAAEDVTHLPAVFASLRPKIETDKLRWIAYIEFGAILPEAAVELNGFYLNPESWTALAEENEKTRDELQKYLWSELKDPSDQYSFPGMKSSLNLDSPEQLLKSLQMMGLKIENTAEVTLAMQVEKYPIVDKLLDYRQAATAVKSFGTEYLTHINKLTKRIHPDYFGFLAAGRYSCSRPNLAQIPRNKKFRKCFQAQDGNELVLADYGNIEMRIIAEISKDPALVEIFTKGKDAHKFTGSVITGKPEDQVTKEERQNAKPVNFGFCIAEGQRVLTQAGLVPIEHIRKDHLVWDGVEWVTHEGLVDMGMREVVTHEGLTATPDHEVYTDDGHKIPLGQLASSLHPRRLAVGAVGDTPVRYTAFDGENRDTVEEPSVRRGELLKVSKAPLDFGRQPQGREKLNLSLSGQVQRFAGINFGGTLRRYGAALREGYARLLAQLQGTGDQGALSFAGALCAVGPSDVSNFGVQGSGLRQDRQRRSLLPDQSEAGGPFNEPAQPQTCRVYDLINAGPRHRFTVEGKVVSNCYGMMPPKLVLYAQSNYGVKMTLTQAETYRKRYFERFQGVAAWHRKALEGKTSSHRIARSIGGRLRYLDEEAHNEWLNTPVQATGADGLKAALRETYFATKKFGKKVRMVHHVHDEIILEVEKEPTLIEESKKALSDSMKKGMVQFIQAVPVDVEAVSGKTWADKG